MNNYKILILGVGFLGNKLLNEFSKNFNVIGADLNHSSNLIKKVDATNKKEIDNLLMKEKPDIVIDTIALSSYFTCETNPTLCRKLNFESAKNIAYSCAKTKTKMIFISSSYIFDGEKGNYLETDIPNSLTKYALSKVDAEKEVLKLENSIVIRLETMYGFDARRKKIVFGTNTFESDIQVAFPNILKKPIYINDIPNIIFQLIQKNKKGIFNIAGLSKIKWLDFLENLAILENSKHKIKIVDNSDWVLFPPNDSSLSTKKINSLGVQLTEFQQSLTEMKNTINFKKGE